MCDAGEYDYGVGCLGQPHVLLSRLSVTLEITIMVLVAWVSHVFYYLIAYL